MFKFKTNNTLLRTSNYTQQTTADNTGRPLKRWDVHLKFPIDSAKSNMGTSGKMHAGLSKMNLLQLFLST